MDSPEVRNADYWVGVNMGSYYGALRLARERTVLCPCCKGTKTITLTTVSERLQGILNKVASGDMPEVKSAPTTLAGEDWLYLMAHPQIVLHKLGYSSNYWFYHDRSEFARRARSF